MSGTIQMSKFLPGNDSSIFHVKARKLGVFMLAPDLVGTPKGCSFFGCLRPIFKIFTLEQILGHYNNSRSFFLCFASALFLQCLMSSSHKLPMLVALNIYPDTHDLAIECFANLKEQSGPGFTMLHMT